MQVLLSVLVWAWWTIVFFTYLFIVSVLYVFTLPFDRYNQIPNCALKGLAGLLMKTVPGWTFVIKGDDLSKIEKPTIVVANHQSFLDMPLLYLLPWSMKWVAKKSLFRIPIFGWIVFMTGHIGIDRKSRRSVKKLDKLVEPVQNQIPAMIFPEGTRTNSGELMPFKNGAFMLAKRYNFQVLPVVLNGGFEAMQPGSWKFNFRQEFTISVLDPLEPGKFESVKEMKDQTFQLIEEELRQIRRADE